MFDSDFKAGKILEWFITVLNLLCTVQLYVINYTFEETFLDYHDKKSPQNYIFKSVPCFSLTKAIAAKSLFLQVESF